MLIWKKALLRCQKWIYRISIPNRLRDKGMYLNTAYEGRFKYKLRRPSFISLGRCSFAQRYKIFVPRQDI